MSQTFGMLEHFSSQNLLYRRLEHKYVHNEGNILIDSNIVCFFSIFQSSVIVVYFDRLKEISSIHSVHELLQITPFTFSEHMNICKTFEL